MGVLHRFVRVLTIVAAPSLTWSGCSHGGSSSAPLLLKDGATPSTSAASIALDLTITPGPPTDTGDTTLSTKLGPKPHGSRYYVIKGAKGYTYFPKNARFIKTAKSFTVYAYHKRYVFPKNVTLQIHRYAYGGHTTQRKLDRTVDTSAIRTVNRPFTDSVVDGTIQVYHPDPTCADCIVVSRSRKKTVAAASARRTSAVGASGATRGILCVSDDPGDDAFYYDPGSDPGCEDPTGGGGQQDGQEDNGNYLDDSGQVSYTLPSEPPPDPLPCLPGTFGCSATWPDDPDDPNLFPPGVDFNSLFAGYAGIVFVPSTYITASFGSAIYFVEIGPPPGVTVAFELGFQNKVQSEHYFCQANAVNAQPVGNDAATAGPVGANFVYRANFIGLPDPVVTRCLGQTPDLTAPGNSGWGFGFLI